MIDWDRALEEVAFAGSTGIKKDELLSRLESLFPDYKFDDVTKPLVWQRICKQPDIIFIDNRGNISERPTESLRVTEATWEHVVLCGKALKLSDQSRSCLQKIAQRGSEGIAQPDLGKALRIDQRNLFFHLSKLAEHEVVVKIPVCSKKAFTYLCLLKRWVVDVETEVIPTADADSMVYRSDRTFTKKKISDILESAPLDAKAKPTAEIFRLCGLQETRSNFRYIRNCLNELVNAGYLEVILTNSVSGPRHPYYLFKRSFDADQPVEILSEDDEAQEDDDEEEGQVVAEGWAPQLQPFISLEKQARDLVAASGSRGLLVRELIEGLGVSTKNGTRLLTRLTERKFIWNSDVVKVAEIHGKERRYRMLIEGAVDQGDQEENFAVSDEDEVVEQHNNKQAKTKISTTEQRQRVFLELIRDQLAIDASRHTSVEFSKRLGIPEANVDIKTIRRMIESLGDAGKIRVLHLASHQRKCGLLTLGISLDVAEDNPRLLERIRILKGEPSAAESEDKEEDDAEEELFRIDCPTRDEARMRNESIGYLHGTMCKLRTLHLYMVERSLATDELTFEIQKWLFDDLPLGLFLGLAGLMTCSAALNAYIPLNSHVPLSQIPKPLYVDLSKRRLGIFKRSLQKVLDLMTSLGLVAVSDERGGISTQKQLQLPYVMRLSPMLHGTVPPDARCARLYSLKEAQQYWTDMQSSWSGYDAEDNIDDLAHVYRLAVTPDEWEALSPQSRAKLAIAEALDIDPALVNLSTARKRRKMLRTASAAPYILPKGVRLDGDEDEEDGVSKTRKRPRARPRVGAIVPASDWTAEEEARLILLVPVLLHQSEDLDKNFFLDWPIVTSLFPGRVAIDLRRHAGRLLLADWCAVQRMVVAERKYLYIRVTHELPEALPERVLEVERILSDLKVTPGAGELVRVWDMNGLGRVMAFWGRSRHYRSALLQHFEDQPSLYVPSIVPASSPIDKTLEDAMQAIKTVVTWPARHYSAERAAMYLARFEEQILQAVRDALLASGYLCKASSKRPKYKIPGTGLSLSPAVYSTFMMEQEDETKEMFRADGKELDAALVQDFDLSVLLDNLLSGQMACDVSEDCTLTLTGSLNPAFPASSDLPALLRSLDLWLLPLRTWFWLAPPNAPSDLPLTFNPSLFRGALSMVLAIVSDDPGVSIEGLREACYPLLTSSELEDVLKVLVHLGLVEASHGGSHWHPKN